MRPDQPSCTLVKGKEKGVAKTIERRMSTLSEGEREGNEGDGTSRSGKVADWKNWHRRLRRQAGLDGYTGQGFLMLMVMCCALIDVLLVAGREARC